MGGMLWSRRLKRRGIFVLVSCGNRVPIVPACALRAGAVRPCRSGGNAARGWPDAARRLGETQKRTAVIPIGPHEKGLAAFYMLSMALFGMT